MQPVAQHAHHAVWSTVSAARHAHAEVVAHRPRLAAVPVAGDVAVPCAGHVPAVAALQPRHGLREVVEHLPFLVLQHDAKLDAQGRVGKETSATDTGWYFGG